MKIVVLHKGLEHPLRLVWMGLRTNPLLIMKDDCKFLVSLGKLEKLAILTFHSGRPKIFWS
jgi:hypothetical protein